MKFKTVFFSTLIGILVHLTAGVVSAQGGSGQDNAIPLASWSYDGLSTEYDSSQDIAPSGQKSGQPNFGLYPSADIELTGLQYSAISGNVNGGWCSWYYVSGDAIFTAWSREGCEETDDVSLWIQYTATLSPGVWRIGLNAINYVWPDSIGLGDDPSWYPEFTVANSLTDEMISIAASDTEIHHGFTEYTVPIAGSYTVRLWWVNDKWEPPRDANITIVSVFFDLAYIPIRVDIKPGSCPNPFNMGASGVLPVAILGTETFDVTQIDPASVRLESIAPLRWSLKDVATPFGGVPEDAYDCTEEGPDGRDDLSLKFDRQELAALGQGQVQDREVVLVTLTGNLKEEFGGTVIRGEDVMVIIDR